MAIQVGNNAVHMIARARRRPVYRAFGLGLDPLELAKRVDALRDQSPQDFSLLFDVANRVLFVDHLRFEVGWHLELPRIEQGEYVRLDHNLDALEIYLLCTCIDALGGAVAPQLSFPQWLSHNRRRVESLVSDAGIESAKRYLEVTRSLFTVYVDSVPGPSRRFVQVFRELPTFVKEYMADGIVVVKGGFESDDFRNRIQRWWQLSVDKRVGRIARDYLWARRRGSYTHRTKVETVPPSGVFRRMAERGTPAHDDTWWNSTSFLSARDPDAVRLTVSSDGAIDEGFLLRAIVTVRALTRILGYEACDGYLHDFFSYYQTVAAAYAFLHEMRQNREYLDFLSAPETIGQQGDFGSYPLPILSMTAATRLLEEFNGLVRLLGGYLPSYVDQSHVLNKRILRFNGSHQATVAQWHRWTSDIADLCQEPSFVQLLRSVRWYDAIIDLSIRRALQTGEILWSCPAWSVVWHQLRQNLAALPRCPSHRRYPHVTTLVNKVTNDILEVNETGITLRSHRTGVERRVAVSVFKAWWDTLVTHGTVSLASPPGTQHSRVVAAVLAASLPHRMRYVAGQLIRAAG